MNKDQQQALSKYMSYVLRHRPEEAHLELDAEAWTELDRLVEACVANRLAGSRDDVLEVVAASDKKRFSLSADGLRIRAAQGHSVNVELALQPEKPPQVLFHGTATRFLDSIQEQGLLPRERQQVHLSESRDTAVRVGQRHGSPVVLEVDAGAMWNEGFKFFRADNGVWLTDTVPAGFLH
ncbi:RNA 2'-phosphotransferase [Hydrogenophaga sp. 5NK40-0174]|uniref:RNA 2'-phosphotransferase n=1 Tax=Hydrogenophaga sp. 5NK40-0174 TaxID=3127649 RepID=UPI00310ABB94